MLRIRGVNTGDQIGWGQSTGLDVNGDRIDDLITVDRSGDILFRKGRGNPLAPFAPPIVVNNRSLADVVARANHVGGDLIAITGDLVDGPVDKLAAHVAPLAELRARHGTYFVTGNHEYFHGVEPILEHVETLSIKPLTNQAITVEHHPRKISKHAMFVPLVHSSHCTGCGICEKACPTQEAAIRVVHPGLVQGKIGDHYRLGWTIDTPITQEFKPDTKARDGSSTQRGLDYLNEGEL